MAEQELASELVLVAIARLQGRGELPANVARVQDELAQMRVEIMAGTAYRDLKAAAHQAASDWAARNG